MSRSALLSIGAVLVAAGLAALAFARGCASAARPASPPPFLTAAPARPAPAPRRPRAKSAGMAPPRLLNDDELQVDIRKYYPADALRAGRSGRVTLSLRVEKDGSVSRIAVEASGGAAFDEAATKAARSMRFSPARKDGKPIVVEISDVLEFSPDGR